MSEAAARAVYMANTDGFDRHDLGLAYEIWREDVCAAQWATREVMKFSVFIVRYLESVGHTAMGARDIEGQAQLETDAVMGSLKILRFFGAVNDFGIDRGQVRMTLHLGQLQRLRVFESRARLKELMQQRQSAEVLSQRPNGRVATAVSDLEANLVAASRKPTDATVDAV